MVNGFADVNLPLQQAQMGHEAIEACSDLTYFAYFSRFFHDNKL
jgi:hypothetical protein